MSLTARPARTLSTAIAVPLLALLAACGGGSGAEDSSGRSPEPETPAPVATSEAPVEPLAALDVSGPERVDGPVVTVTGEALAANAGVVLAQRSAPDQPDTTLFLADMTGASIPLDLRSTWSSAYPFADGFIVLYENEAPTAAVGYHLARVDSAGAVVWDVTDPRWEMTNNGDRDLSIAFTPSAIVFANKLDEYLSGTAFALDPATGSELWASTEIAEVGGSGVAGLPVAAICAHYADFTWGLIDPTTGDPLDYPRWESEEYGWKTVSLDGAMLLTSGHPAAFQVLSSDSLTEVGVITLSEWPNPTAWSGGVVVTNEGARAIEAWSKDGSLLWQSEEPDDEYDQFYSYWATDNAVYGVKAYEASDGDGNVTIRTLLRSLDVQTGEELSAATIDGYSAHEIVGTTAGHLVIQGFANAFHIIG